MKKGILTSLGLAAVLTLGLASVNEYREVKEGVIFKELAPFVTDQSIINLININYQNKDLLNYIINIAFINKIVKQERR